MIYRLLSEDGLSFHREKRRVSLLLSLGDVDGERKCPHEQWPRILALELKKVGLWSRAGASSYGRDFSNELERPQDQEVQPPRRGEPAWPLGRAVPL